MLDHLDDLDADFHRYYGISDMYDLESVRFFRLAYRVSVYGGVMAHRAEQARDRGSDGLRPAGAQQVPLEAMAEFID